MKTFDSYVKAIKLQYELEKNGEYGGFLLQPSPAQLRNLCLVVYDKGLSKKDKDQFYNFFAPKQEKDLRKSIQNVDVERFKAFGAFFKGKSETTNLTNLELIAVLVNFPQRPLKDFLKNEDAFSKNIKEREKEKKRNTSDYQNIQTIDPEEAVKRNNYLLVGWLLVGFFSVGYIAKDTNLSKKRCMQWQEDHYEVVDCEVGSIRGINPIVALNKQAVELKKVTLKKGMSFFKYDKPLYYYHKVSKGNVEFFNAPGLHPITGKPLKEITPYIIHKYIY